MDSVEVLFGQPGGHLRNCGRTSSCGPDQALVAIQTGGDGELYFVSRGGTNTNPGQVPPGVVYRLEADQ